MPSAPAAAAAGQREQVVVSENLAMHCRSGQNPSAAAAVGSSSGSEEAPHDLLQQDNAPQSSL